MLSQNNDLKLQTNDQSLILNLENVVKFTGGAGYRCNLVVQSRGFGCKHLFYFDETNIRKAIENLETMNKTFQGEAVLGEEYEESEVRFVVNSKGQVIVTGTIVEYSEYSQRLEFSFRTDQTVLTPLIKDLRKIREMEPRPVTQLNLGKD